MNIIKATQVRISKDGKSAQAVILVGTGSARKSKTIHVNLSRSGEMIAPNPFFSREEILAGYRLAETKVADAKLALEEAQKHERNMMFLGSEKRSWLKPHHGDADKAKSTWHELAVKETEKASRHLEEMIANEAKVKENFPIMVKFEAEQRITAGKKPAQKRAA